jgi:hypothetical protein
MKLSEHTEHIRQLIDQSFRNRLGRMGINASQLISIESIPQDYHTERKRMEGIREVFIKETGNVADGYEKLVEELTFTLFNRLAALKVMESHTLHPEIITRRESHGGRSFAHLAWLEQNPQARGEEAEGLISFLEDQLQKLASDIPLFSPQHPYHLLPTALELQGIINAFNNVETDAQVEGEIWKSDDVLGWLYESYNNYKKSAHKLSGDKTEYNKVSIQSQVYTPRWVVQFLVDNSLGKLYLEMYPDSEIRNKYKIANVPTSQTRDRKPLHEIKTIDPSTGSGNYLLYGFDMYYDLYIDQIENYGADYNEAEIPKLIIENNLHGIDLDDRAIQLAQLGLYIKAKRKKRTVKIEHFNIVSSDFLLPDFDFVLPIFRGNISDSKQLETVESIWTDLQNAYKFGSLVRLNEKIEAHISALRNSDAKLFSDEEETSSKQFKEEFLKNLTLAFERFASQQGNSFLSSKTQDAITFLQLLTQKYDVAVANPPYTDSADFGTELRIFVEANYKQPYKFNTNLYAAFIKRCSELVIPDGFLGMLHPLTFMYISTFKDVRNYILTKTNIEILAELGLGGVFANSDVQADVVAYVLRNNNNNKTGLFLDFKKYKNHTNKPEIFFNAYDNIVYNKTDEHVYELSQNSFKDIEDWPFIYWISDKFRAKFKTTSLKDSFSIAQGIATSDNDKFVRHWWEVVLKYNDELYLEGWHTYSKGGPYNKWYGNNWAVVDWKNNGYAIRNAKDEKGKQRSRTQNEQFYLKKGVTYSAAGSKGASFRIHNENSLFDVGGSCVFPTKDFKNLEYLIALLNSKLSFYILECLNPTVNTQVGDMQRIPFVKPIELLENRITHLSKSNIEIKKTLSSYKLVELAFDNNPILKFKINHTNDTLKERLLSFLLYENTSLSIVLINEALIDKLIFEVYELSYDDQNKVVNILGNSIGSFPLAKKSKEEFILFSPDLSADAKQFILELPEIIFDENLIREIKENFNYLYQGNSNLEEFCIKYQVNPINVWYWFKEENFLPNSVASEFALEFLADTFRTLLIEDEDGIIPLVGLPGEDALSQRLEQYCLKNGLTSAQFLQLDGLLGRPLNQYIEHYFFIDFSNHIKLFKQMPSTPFIWHLSSGKHQGFEAFILIYKWNRDSLFKLKSHYISHRVQNLEYRQITLQDVNTAQAQTEKETIRLQLQEIKVFTAKIDELIAEGYEPKLDDGVGKNIAPLQKKGLLRAEVLKTTGGSKSQLEKYLKADW